MAKNGKAKWVGVGLTTLLIIAGVIVSFVWAQADIKAIDVKADSNIVLVETLKEEGCTPAKQSKTDVAVIKSEITSIKDDIKGLRTEQKAATDEILRRLPE